MVGVSMCWVELSVPALLCEILGQEILWVCDVEW
jgi:hypothetical protein